MSKGGDLTAFVVEHVAESSPRTIELLMCGNGQWGGLGSKTYSNAQSVPIQAKYVSGLTECKTAVHLRLTVLLIECFDVQIVKLPKVCSRFRLMQ